MGAAESAPGAADADEAAAARRARGIARVDARLRERLGTQGVRYNLRVVLRGGRRAGKTALFERLAGRGFSDAYEATRELRAATIAWAPRDGRERCKVDVWDVCDEAEAEGAVDAASIDVYDGAAAAVFLVDPRDATTLDYVVDKLRGLPGGVDAVVLRSFADAADGSGLTESDVAAALEPLGRRIRVLSASAKTCAGLDTLHAWLALPFLRLVAGEHRRRSRARRSGSPPPRRRWTRGSPPPSRRRRGAPGGLPGARRAPRAPGGARGPRRGAARAADAARGAKVGARRVARRRLGRRRRRRAPDARGGGRLGFLGRLLRATPRRSGRGGGGGRGRPKASNEPARGAEAAPPAVERPEADAEPPADEAPAAPADAEPPAPACRSASASEEADAEPPADEAPPEPPRLHPQSRRSPRSHPRPRQMHGRPPRKKPRSLRRSPRSPRSPPRLHPQSRRSPRKHLRPRQMHGRRPPQQRRTRPRP